MEQTNLTVHFVSTTGNRLSNFEENIHNLPKFADYNSTSLHMTDLFDRTDFGTMNKLEGADFGSFGTYAMELENSTRWHWIISNTSTEGKALIKLSIAIRILRHYSTERIRFHEMILPSAVAH